MPLSRRHLGMNAARTLLSRVSGDPLTYAAVGMSLGEAEIPDGFHELDARAVVGRGEDAFRAVGYALMTWDIHRRAGFAVQAYAPSVVIDQEVAVAMPIGPAAAVGACRVTAIVAEPRACGFAYGTLPRHPECGEESFIVVWNDDDSVELRIHAFSYAAAWFARLGGPISRRMQQRAAARLLKAAQAVAAQPKATTAA